MPKAQRIQKWVNEELDVLMSTVDAEKTLEQLEVDRETICKMMQRCEVNGLNILKLKYLFFVIKMLFAGTTRNNRTH